MWVISFKAWDEPPCNYCGEDHSVKDCKKVLSDNRRKAELYYVDEPWFGSGRWTVYTCLGEECFTSGDNDRRLLCQFREKAEAEKLCRELNHCPEGALIANLT